MRFRARVKNAANATFSLRRVACWELNDQRPCRSGSKARMSLSWAD
jgi:hypothetical protein